MEMDASSAGVSPGGLTSTAEIKILICYILSTAEDPVPGKHLAELLHYEGLANYFEVESAITSLLEKQQIKTAKEPDTYVITESGRDVAKTLRASVPFTVREKAYYAATKMLARRRNERETKIDIIRQTSGEIVSFCVMEGEREMLTVRLYVADDGQAELIKNNILEDPSAIYTGILKNLIGDETKNSDSSF